ncbi:YcdB/YcdC domain-containing protein [Peptococcaceae bacterium 1198_IL3148]
MPKKKIIGLSASCLAAGLLLFNPLAEAETKVIAESLPLSNAIGERAPVEVAEAKMPLDKAIEKAKQTFNIGEDYDKFNSNLSTYNGKTHWELSWNRSAEPEGSIVVRINAVTGEIASMDNWQNQPNNLSGLPQYNYGQAGKLAAEWALKLAPNHYSATKLTPDEQLPYHNLTNRGPIEYSYYFHRVVNGVPYKENSIAVRINADTGQLVGYNFNWEDNKTFPGTTNIINANQAAAVLKDNVKLTYFQPQNSKENNQVKLVYQVPRGAGLFIDAHSGKVINEPSYYTHDWAIGGLGAMSKEAEQSLSPAEQAEVEKLNNLISEESALKIAKKSVKIPSDAKLMESRLTENHLSGQKMWHFNWNNDHGSLNITIDAATGELSSFNNWLNRENIDNNEKPKYTLAQAQQIAADFIKQQQPQRFKSVELDDSVNYGVIPYEKPYPISHRIGYVRMVNGIPFPSNGFDVQVNLYTGEIINYNMNWWDADFPKPTNVLGTDRAAATFMADDGLVLDYVTLNHSTNNPKVYLAYHLKERPSFTIDAISGQYLDWQGKPLAAEQTTKFTDIAGHPAADAINTLAAAGILKSSDNKFYPDKNITKMDALTWLVASRDRYQLERPLEDMQKNVVDAAIRMGIIEREEAKDLDQELTRLEYAKLMINFLDYDGAAKLNDIYLLTSKDANKVPANLKGYVALSLGLGLQTENNGNYNPQDTIPRGYAAVSLLRLLQVTK